jgi:hypothetical protein
MGKALRLGALSLSLLVMLGCGPGQPNASDTALVTERPELTEAEYRLYWGTGEDLQEQEDRALVGAAVGAMGSAQGPAPFLVASALIAGRVTHAGGGSPAAAPAGETKPEP